MVDAVGKAVMAVAVEAVAVRRVVMVGLNGDGCTHCHFASPAIPCSSHCVCVSACLWL